MSPANPGPVNVAAAQVQASTPAAFASGELRRGHQPGNPYLFVFVERPPVFMAARPAMPAKGIGLPRKGIEG